MQNLKVALPEELWQQVQAYRRARGAQLGIPTIDVQVAVVQLLEKGLAEVQRRSDEAPVTDQARAATRPFFATKPLPAARLRQPHLLRLLQLSGRGVSD